MKTVPRRLLVLGGGPVGVEMAQAVHRLGGEVRLIEGAPNLLEGIEPFLGAAAAAARREGDEYILELGDGNKLSGDRLLVATGRRHRIDNIGLETVGVEVNGHGVPVDSPLRVAERLWAVGDITGIWQLTHVGKYQGEVVASNILGEPREANHDAVPRVVFTDPQAAAVGATNDRVSGTARLSQLAKTETYTRAYAESKGFLILLSDGQRLTGAYALGPEAGEWLQQATLPVRARVPIEVLKRSSRFRPSPRFTLRRSRRCGRRSRRRGIQ
jgi:pyruvate/2-oxoglutarate dehydrogenase complex dihydrolipoamide dehydrogenase (E3) component